jgi:hypothetical protein
MDSEGAALDIRPAAQACVLKPERDGRWPLATQALIVPWDKTEEDVAKGDIEHVMLVPRAQWEAAMEGRCVACGCTEHAACAGGCAWYEPGLCTKCAPTEFKIEVL